MNYSDYVKYQFSVCLRRASRYESPYIEEGQTTQWPNAKGPKDKQ